MRRIQLTIPHTIQFWIDVLNLLQSVSNLKVDVSHLSGLIFHTCMIARIQGFVKCIVPLLLVAHGITVCIQLLEVQYSIVVHDS
jgi:hypothetical protein